MPDRLGGQLRAEKRREHISTLRSAPKSSLCEGSTSTPKKGELTELEPKEEAETRESVGGALV